MQIAAAAAGRPWNLELLREGLAIAKRRPLATAVAFAAVKGVLADLMAQLVVEGRRLRGVGSDTARDTAKTYDWHRTVALAAFSGAYCGGFFYWQFSVLFPRIWGTPKLSGLHPPWQHVLGQVALDNFFFSPCLYCPVFYITRGAIVQAEWPRASLQRYAAEFKEVFATLLTVWVPAGIVNFTFMPVCLRAPFCAVVSFGYLTWLSVQAAAAPGMSSASAQSTGRASTADAPHAAAHAAVGAGRRHEAEMAGGSACQRCWRTQPGLPATRCSPLLPEAAHRRGSLTHDD